MPKKTLADLTSYEMTHYKKLSKKWRRAVLSCKKKAGRGSNNDVIFWQCIMEKNPTKKIEKHINEIGHSWYGP